MTTEQFIEWGTRCLRELVPGGCPDCGGELEFEDYDENELGHAWLATCAGCGEEWTFDETRMWAGGEYGEGRPLPGTTKERTA